MSIEEALSSINLPEPDAGSGSMTHANFVFFDEGRDEVLSLHFRRAAWSEGCLYQPVSSPSGKSQSRRAERNSRANRRSR